MGPTKVLLPLARVACRAAQAVPAPEPAVGCPELGPASAYQPRWPWVIWPLLDTGDTDTITQIPSHKVTLAERGGGKAPAPRLLVLSGAVGAVELGAKLLVELCPSAVAV